MNDRRYSYIRHLIPIVIAVTVAAAMAWPTSAQPPLPPDPPDGGDGENPPAAYVPGEILVQFKPAVGALGAQSALAAQGLQATGAIPAIGVLKVKVKPGQELETIARLERNPNVAYAEPNYVAFAFETVPNDPGYGNQWGLPKISAPAAWDITTGSSDVVIAIVDTGIDLEHPDFNCPGKFVPGYDFYNNDSNPDDDNGHGTHVAGIAAACTNNAIGVAGVAWKASLLPVKVLDASGYGTYDQVADGIIYAADQGADVINLSLGGINSSSTMSDAIDYARNQGALVLAAAGNCGSGCYIGYQYYYNPVFYPAAYSSTMAVAATGSSDNWATFSGHRPYVEVAAPGDDIYSTFRGSYAYLDGTSMATPYVSGLAALIWSLEPSLTHDQVRQVIQSTADDLGTPGKDDYFGYGRIDAWQALDSLFNLETSPAQVSFLIDADSGPFPPTAAVQITTTSSEPINWTTGISPPVNWLAVLPPASGSVSAAASDSFTLVVPARPPTQGTFSTTVIVTGTTPSGAVVGWATTQVRITYVSELYQYRMPIMYK